LPNKRTLARLQLQFPYGSSDGNLLWTLAGEDDTAAPRRVFLKAELLCITLTAPFEEFTLKGDVPLTLAMQKGGLVFTAVVLLVLLTTAATSTMRGLPETRPLLVVSILGPVKPYTPGGPTIRMTLQNVGDVPVTSLTTTLRLAHTPGVTDGTYAFHFSVSDSTPLLSNQVVTDTETLFEGGFDGALSYPLSIYATLQDGTRAVYVQEVKITPPP